MQESLCSNCKNYHDPIDFEACDRMGHPQLYAQMLESRKNRALANEAAKKRRHASPEVKAAYRKMITGN